MVEVDIRDVRAEFELLEDPPSDLVFLDLFDSIIEENLRRLLWP